MYAEFFIGILLVIFCYLISRVSNMPFYIDPYGEESVRLTNRLNPISRLTSRILSFLSFGKYKILSSSAWRAKKIEETTSSKEEPLVAKFITGETGRGMRGSIGLALEKGFKVILLTGKPYCDAVDAIKEFINHTMFELYIDVNHRPEPHFSIFANKHLFLEVPHTPTQEKKYSLGINNANPEIVDFYTEKFDKTKDTMRKITSVKEFEEIVNKYCLYASQKGKPWWQFWKKNEKLLNTSIQN